MAVGLSFVQFHRNAAFFCFAILLAGCSERDSGQHPTAHQGVTQPAAPQQETDLAQQRIIGPFTVVNQPISDVLRMIHDHTGIQFMLGTDGLTPVTMSLNDPTVVEVLDALREAADVDYELTMRDDGPVITVMDKHRMQQPEEPPVAEGEVALNQIRQLQTVIQGPVIAQDTPLGYVLQSLQAQSGVQFLPGNAADVGVSLSLESPTILQIVEAIINSHEIEARAVYYDRQYVIEMSRTESR